MNWPEARRTLLLAGLSLPLWAWGQTPAAAPPLPDRYSVPTGTRSLTPRYLVAVHDGHVWLKKNPDDTRPRDPRNPRHLTPLGDQATAEWKLLDGSGLAKVDGQEEALTQVSVDDERLLAVAAGGDLLRYEDGVWARKWGLPIPVEGFLKPVQLPADATQWTLSMRLGEVEYYEDRRGNQFNWGAAGCTTVFALRGDGSRIAQGDPWFPPDLSREMCGPHRGTFKAVGLASSASVTMVIDAAGEVQTRFYDYDANGGTPFFIYRYEDFPQQPLPGTDPASELQIRALPEEDWVAQPRIPALGATRLTKRIAVLQVGKGNFARELRVLALGPGGEAGYFTKGLRDSAWRFVATGEALDPADFIENDPARSQRAPSRDRFYTGGIAVRGKAAKDVAYVTVPDFNLHCQPTHMRLVLPSGHAVELTISLIDSWTFFENQDPEDTPDAFKTLKGTVELSPETQASPYDDVRAVAERYFGGRHLRPFSYEIVANQKEFRLYPAGYPYGLTRDDFEVRLHAPGTDPLLHPYRAKFAQYVGDSTRCVPVSVFQELLDDRASLDNRLQVTRAVRYGVPSGTLVMDGVSVVTGMRWWSPGMTTLRAFEEHAPALTIGMQHAFLLFKERSASDYAATKAMLQERLCSLPQAGAR